MAIYFSEKFKNFRKTRNLTQEQIADIFHVSPQAVSRWETGATYPDIEILPSLADFFGVTIDDLLGVDIGKKEKRVLEIFEQTDKLISRQEKDGSEIDETIDILNNGLREFPNNVYLLARLSGTFRRKAIICKEAGKEDEMKKYAEKSLKLSERLVNEYNNYTAMPVLEQKYGINSKMRYGAIGNIAYLYNEINETDKAVEWANKLPNIYYTKTTVLSRVLKDEEKIDQLKQNICDCSDVLNGELKIFANVMTKSCEEYDNFMREYEQFKIVVSALEKYTKNV